MSQQSTNEENNRRYLVDTAIRFVDDHYIQFPSITQRRQGVALRLSSKVKEFVDSIDKKTVGKRIKKSKKRNWILRLWDLTNAPIETMEIKPATNPYDQYKSIFNAVLYSEDRDLIPGHEEQANKLCKDLINAAKDLKIEEMTAAGYKRSELNANDVDETLVRSLAEVTMSLAQLPNAYKELYLKSITILPKEKSDEKEFTCYDGLSPRGEGRAAGFVRAIATLWEKAGCKNAEDIKGFETWVDKRTGMLPEMTSERGYKGKPQNPPKAKSTSKNEALFAVRKRTRSI